MAEITVDTLVTELEYKADLKTLAKANVAVKDLEKQNKATATATDTLTQAQSDLGEEIARETKRLNQLKDRQADLRREIKLSGRETKTQRLQMLNLEKQITNSSRKTRELRVEQAQLSRQKARVSRGTRELAQDERRLAQAVSQATDKLREQRRAARENAKELARGVGTGAQAAAGTIAGVVGAGATGFALLGKEVLTVGTSFETLRARLKTVEGSAQGAGAAFAQIQEFTKTTPFQLDEVTTAYVRLKSLGLDASQESMMAFGNLAAAQGKSIIDFIEAVADASTGEFERLKEFGIKASSQGDQVAFTFKGATTTVGKNAEEIQAFLKNIGETEFAGAMADQMATASGAISNLKDTVATTFDTVAQMGPLDEFKLLLADVSGLAGDEGLARILAEGLTRAIKAVREIIADLTQEDIEGFLQGMADAAQMVIDAIKFLVDVFQGFVQVTGDAGSALEALTLIAAGVVAAMTGPGGIVVAAGLVGVALGEMAANGIAELTGLNDTIDTLDSRIKNLRKDIADREKRIDAIENRMTKRQQALEAKREAYAKQRGERLERVTGGLGEGLVRAEELGQEEAGFQAQFIELGDEASAAAAQEKLFTEEGRVVLSAVQGAEAKKIAETEQRARKEARRRGASETEVEAAALRARRAAEVASQKTRRKAFETAQKTFAETGSAEAAALAGARAVEGRGKKGAVKKGKASKEDLLSKDIQDEIDKAALQAGKRAAARAALQGTTDQATLNKIQRARRKEVETRLTERFQATGELPPGLATDLTQIANLPNIEAATGKLAPPVITVNNFKTDVTVEAINANVTVEGGINGTPQQVANASANAVRAVTMQDLGRALQNSLTNLR